MVLTGRYPTDHSACPFASSQRCFARARGVLGRRDPWPTARLGYAAVEVASRVKGGTYPQRLQIAQSAAAMVVLALRDATLRTGGSSMNWREITEAEHRRMLEAARREAS